MNIDLIYEPYIFTFVIALIISVVYYFYEKNKIDQSEEEQKDNNLFGKSIIALLLSYIIIMILYYSYKYISFEFNGSVPIIAGGGVKSILSNSESDDKNIDAVIKKREKIMERLTVVDDDIDVSILED